MINEDFSNLIPIFLILINIIAIIYLISRNRFTSLYWSAVLMIFTGPTLSDKFLGMPYKAFEGMVGFSTPFSLEGINNAQIFALGHMIFTLVAYAVLFKFFPKKYQLHETLIPPVLWKKLFFQILLICFVASSIIFLIYRGDLSRPFNDFLSGNVRSEYESYFFLASSPLSALGYYLYPKKKSWKIFIGTASVIVAYFIGIRYYMLPFIGYVVWYEVITSNVSTQKKIFKMTTLAIAAWVLVTAWGIIRGLDLRNNPLEILNLDKTFLVDTMFVGNELPARVSYYDLMGRLQRNWIPRRFGAIEATLLEIPYPFLTRTLGVWVPLSNSKLVYVLQTGIIGSGVSTGTTVFGNDYFTWGWLGMIIGGLSMGIILYLFDSFYLEQGGAWMLIGPMATFQLVFFARGGTDVWLGIWGRYLPISVALLIFAKILSKFHEKKSNAYRNI